MNKKIVSYLAICTVAFIYSCGGGEKNVEQPKTEEAKSENTSVASNIEGKDVYKKTCIACHQANGEGIANTFPPLAKSDFLTNKDAAIQQVIKGKTGELTVNGVKYNNTMPPQAISDEEIAAVLTYVYGNWGNNGTTVSVDDVKAARSKAQ